MARPELREKMAKDLAKQEGKDYERLFEFYENYGIIDIWSKKYWLLKADQILALIIPQEKPPLLSDEALKQILAEVYEHYYDAELSVTVSHTAIAQAQWDIWNKAIYGEVENGRGKESKV